MKRSLLLVPAVIIVLLLGVVGLVELLDRPLYAEPVSPRCKLTIRKKETSKDKVKLYVTFHYPPAIGMVSYAELELKKMEQGLQFDSVKDEDSGLQCIYDANGSGFVFLFDHRTEDSWITGLPTEYADSPGLWSDRFKIVKSRFPQIPYDDLPTLDR